MATVTISLLVAACSNMDGKQAALCTAASSDSTSALCDPPKTPVSLTLPRAELLTKVNVPEVDPITTASSGTSDGEATPASPPAAEAPPAAATPAAAAPAAAAPAPAEPAETHPATPAKAAPPAGADEPKKPADSEPKKAEEDPIDARLKAPRASAGNQKLVIEKIAAIDGRSRKGEPGINDLREATRRAITDHPLIGLAGARVTEALATIGVSESALYPQLEGRAGAGPGVSGAYQNADTSPFFSNKNHYGALRSEASLAGRQLLFDFGATKSDIARTSALYDSENLKLREQTESIASQVSDVYLKLLEQRELYTAAAENLKALEKIVTLVEQNEKNGNGTVADMKRVRSRLIDGQSNLADAKSELQTGTDRFIRLVRMSPGALRQVPNFGAAIPRSPEAAIALVPKGNPRVQALDAALRATRHEIETQKATVLPKLSLETDIGMKDYRTRVDKAELDAKGLVVLKYKFLDGGLQSKQLEQLSARTVQAEMRLKNDVEDLEADIRKQYRILQSARSKSASLADNVVTSEKARQLYDEQFRGGKRTLLELLDIQTTYYTTRRTAINNRYEEQRAINAVLLDIGRLTPTLLGGR